MDKREYLLRKVHKLKSKSPIKRVQINYYFTCYIIGMSYKLYGISCGAIFRTFYFSSINILSVFYLWNRTNTKCLKSTPFRLLPYLGHCCFLTLAIQLYTHTVSNPTYSPSPSLSSLLWKWSEQDHNAQILLWMFPYVRSVPSESCACQS